MASSIPGYGYIAYGQSKLANILYVKELARRYPNITSVVVVRFPVMQVCVWAYANCTA